jgi:hypothetical protein
VFGPGVTVTSAGLDDAFLADFSAAGAPQWARSFGGPGHDVGLAVVEDPGVGLVASGGFEGDAAFGSSSLTSAGERDGFVVGTAGDGSTSWATSFGGTGNDVATGLTFYGSQLWASGGFEGDVVFGAAGLRASGGFEGKLALQLDGATGAIAQAITNAPTWASRAYGIAFGSTSTTNIRALCGTFFDDATANGTQVVAITLF